MVLAEVTTGMMTGVAQGVAAGVAETVPTVAASAVSVLPEVASTAATGLGEAAMGVAQAPAMIAQTAQEVGSSLGEAVTGAHEGLVSNALEAVAGVATPAEAAASQLEAFLDLGGSGTKALDAFAEGAFDFADSNTTLVLQGELVMGMTPQKVESILSQVGNLEVPTEVMEDAAFREAFAQNVWDEMSQLGKNGQEISGEDKQSVFARSAERAMQQYPRRGSEGKPTAVNPKELEKLKRKAALEALHQQMNRWRADVMADKRLTPEAKQIALRKVDVVEQRLTIQQAIAWDGPSMMKYLALAVTWIQEM